MAERFNRFLFLGMLLVGALLPTNKIAWAVVGHAESFDQFQQEELDEFHETLIEEENKKAMDMIDELKKQRKNKEQLSSLKEYSAEELAMLKKELLAIPDRDRFRMGLTGKVRYDSNIERNTPRNEKGDSVFDALGFFEVDLSGKKTDLRYEFNFGKTWNIIYSEDDRLKLESRLRYRRKYFTKVHHNLQSRISRNSSKTVEIDSQKIRYDFINLTAFNWAFSRKLSLNLDGQLTQRRFRQEAFDEDSSWQATFNPSFFWNITPKSRISGGYSFGASRIRSKSGDSNTHDINLGYFGKITRKSSASVTLARSHQTPRSEDTAISDTYTIGLGYIYQMTPKTQVLLQILRSLQNTTVELTDGTEFETTKTDTHFTNDSVTLSVNSRLTRKITSTVTANVAHVRTKTFVDTDPDENKQARVFTFPLSWTLNYQIKKWVSLNIGYRFTFRTGNEKTDTFRSHVYNAGMVLSF